MHYYVTMWFKSGITALTFLSNIYYIGAEAPVLISNSTSVKVGEALQLTCTHSTEQVADWWRKPANDTTFASTLSIGYVNNVCTSVPATLPDVFSHCGCRGATQFTCTLKPLSTTNHGDSWKCSVAFKLQATFSNEISLTITNPVTYLTLTPALPTISVLPRVAISFIRCVSSVGRPTPVITWHLDNRTPSDYTDDVDLTGNSSSGKVADVTTSNLTITPTLVYHGARIYCNASNGYGTITSNRALLIDVLTYPSKPTVLHETSLVSDTISVIQNRTVSLICNSSGNPTPSTSWTLSNSSVINNPMITLKWEQRNNTDIVTCSATSILTPTNGSPKTHTNVTSLHVNILYPPSGPVCILGAFEITSKIIRSVINETLTMNCISSSNPLPSRYTWRLPGGEESNGTQVIIQRVQSSGNGIYTLEVVNEMNATFEKQVVIGNVTASYTLELLYPVTQLSLYHRGMNDQHITSPTISVLRDREFSLRCNALSNPPASYVWTSNGTLSATGANWSTSLMDDTIIQCIASNTLDPTGKETNITSSFINLTAKVLFAPETPSFIFQTCKTDVQTNYLKVIQGHSIRGTCAAKSKPSPTYSWTPDTIGIADGFFISNVSTQHSGEYTCIADNEMITAFDGKIKGKNQSSFQLDVIEPPVVQSLSNTTGLLKGNVSFACPYTPGNLVKTRFAWFHANTPTIESGRNLTLTNIQLTDEGYYTCRVNTTMEPTGCGVVEAYDETSFYVDVQYPVNIRRFYADGFNFASNITINESQTLILVCEADSDPVAKLKLVNNTRDGERLLREEHNNTIYATVGNARCEFDNGVYQCKGKNLHNAVEQVREMDIMILCKPRPSPFSPPITNVFRRSNDSVVLVFTIVANPPPSDISAYVWMKKMKDYGDWVTLNTTSEFQIHISEDRLQTNLSISQLHGEDFTNYSVRVYNGLGSTEQEFVILASEQPGMPQQFHIVDDVVTESYVTVEWKPGFDGGEDQWFVIGYKKAADETWNFKNVSATVSRMTIDNLVAGTTYEIKMYAENSIGKSDETTVLTVVRKAAKSDGENSALITAIGGALGGVVGVVVIIVILVVIWKRRNNGKAKRASQRLFKSKKKEGTVYENSLFRPDSVENVTKEATASIDNTTYNQSKETSSPRLGDGLQRTPSFVIVPEPLYGNAGDFKLKVRSTQIQELRQFTLQCKQDPTDIFRDFYSLDTGLKYETSAARSKVNVPKNRYRNMYPYDKNRVKLPPIDGEEDSDFINASFIDGYEKTKKYIAAQGPLERTIPDIWRMIVAENIQVVAMVTNTVEDGKRKCFQYWPDDTLNPCQYGDFKITLIQQEEYADFVIRKLQCSKANSKKVHTIYQCHFTAWPDKDVPDTALSLLQFWRKVRSHANTGTSPWLVHCSAGVGRTGTFIALDYLCDQGKALQEINVHDAVKALREQRINMVQTKNQYLYLHEVLCEALEPIGFVAQNKEYLATCSLIHSGIASEFKRLREAEEYNAKQAAGNDTLAVEDRFRPMLLHSASGDSNYTNAVNISTFREQKKIMLTPSTIEGSTDVNFLWLLHDYKLATVVILNEQMETYIPDQGKNTVTGPFSGKLVSKTIQSHYTELLVRFQYYAEHDSFDVRIFHFTLWPKKTKVCKKSDILHLLIGAQDAMTDGPVVVQCSDGYTRSGLFAVLWCIVERIKRDGEVAVAETVRMTKRRCQRIIPNEEQYRFCHEFAREYAEGCMTYENT